MDFLTIIGVMNLLYLIIRSLFYNLELLLVELDLRQDNCGMNHHIKL